MASVRFSEVVPRGHEVSRNADPCDVISDGRHGRWGRLPRNINRVFDIRCERAEVRRITIHHTCRTCGSLLVALDVHPCVAMQILRHSRVALTMEVYT
jgi:integrase